MDENEAGFCAVQGIFKKIENIGLFLPLTPNNMLDYHVLNMCGNSLIIRLCSRILLHRLLDMIKDCLFKYLYDFSIIFITKVITLVGNAIHNLHM
jgi:hypothetical protein